MKVKFYLSADGGPLIPGHLIRRKKRCARPDRNGSRLQHRTGRRQIHSAGHKKRNVRKRRHHRIHILFSARKNRKELHQIRAGFPGRQNLIRRKRSRDCGNSVFPGDFNHALRDRRGNQKFRARFRRRLRHGGGQNGARSDMKSRKILPEFPDRIARRPESCRIGGIEGEFQKFPAPRSERLRAERNLFFRNPAQNRNQGRLSQQIRKFHFPSP